MRLPALLLQQRTCSPNLPPSPRSLDTGSGASSAGTAEAGSTVCWEGLCRLRGRMGMGAGRPVAWREVLRSRRRLPQINNRVNCLSIHSLPATQLGHELGVCDACAAGIPQLLLHRLPQLRYRRRSARQQPLAGQPLVRRALPPGGCAVCAAYMHPVCKQKSAPVLSQEYWVARIVRGRHEYSWHYSWLARMQYQHPNSPSQAPTPTWVDGQRRHAAARLQPPLRLGSQVQIALAAMGRSSGQ